jgi:hypothetical protein
VLTGEAAIQGLAYEMIDLHGADAALRAVERLNDHIDQGDLNGSVSWAAVVHAIHDLQQAVLPPATADTLALTLQRSKEPGSQENDCLSL